MTGKLRIALISSVVSLLTAFSAHSQFVMSGTDDARLKWMSIQSANYKVIYPVGCDSLARVYLQELEINRPRVAASLGMTANEGRKNPLPVVLHVQNSLSNGMVTWTPRRMELNTLPEWTNPSSMPWTTMLAIHEGRHAAQMCNGYRKVFKPFYYILGEITPGAAAAWPGSLFLEGDAVIAETALTKSGRGRSSEFLGYYDYAFNTGDTRNWMKWRHGSYYNYTPNHYAFGYSVLSGIRTKYEAPLFMADYFDYVSRRPYDPWPFRHVLRRTSGKKFKESFPVIMTANHDDWVADTASRAPYLPYSLVSKPSRRYTSYSNPNTAPNGDGLWVKEDLYHTPALVRITEDGKEKKIFSVSPNIGKMNYEKSDSTLFWNETRKSARWSHRVKNVVRSYSFATGKRRTYSGFGDCVYPVGIGPDSLAVIRYKENGEEQVTVLREKDFKCLQTISVPDSLQILELAAMDGTLYAVGISSGGNGIYKVRIGATPKWTVELPPMPFKVSSLEAEDGNLFFESDMNGVGEYYRYVPCGKELFQMTSSLYGSLDFNMCANGGITSSMVCKEGSHVTYTKAEDLLDKPVKWGEYHHYAVADTLSAQEERLKEGYDVSKPLACNQSRTLEWKPEASDAGLSSPKRYRKFGSGIRLHSWAPLYADVDALSSMSYESIKNLAHLGAMAFFQNDLSTFSGWVGYQAKYVGEGSGDGGSGWRNAGHVSLTYSGIYPEFEAYFHINEASAANYYLITPAKEKGPADYDKTAVEYTGKARIRTGLTVRVPLSWNNGVLQYGVIPYAGIVYTNDMVYGEANVLYNAGVRAYVQRHVPKAAVYPTLGIGAEYKWADACSYAYLYGWLPGAGWGQGLKLSVLRQEKHKENYVFVSSYANLMPRGYAFTSSGVLDGYKLTADYAAPFYMGDWHIGDAFYCKRGIVTPHFDISWINNPKIQNAQGTGYGDLWSAGATFEMEFASFFWVKTPMSIGITYSYNGGSLYDPAGYDAKHHNFVGATFSMSLF